MPWSRAKKERLKELNDVENVPKKFKKAGKDMIIVDSGAGESVCPADWIPLEPVKHTGKVGIKYKAAGGQTLVNRGEKNVKFSVGGRVASMNFQAIDELTKPLASVAKIAAKDNTVVMRGPDKSSYIENDVTGMRIPLTIENGVYVMAIDVLLEEAGESVSPFGRQA